MQSHSRSLKLPNLSSCTVCVIGLGYVGLPLALEISGRNTSNSTGKILNRKAIGYDISDSRIIEIQSFKDSTGSVTSEQLRQSSNISFTSDSDSIEQADIYIVTVPTPVDVFNRSDLPILISALETVGQALKRRK